MLYLYLMRLLIVTTAVSSLSLPMDYEKCTPDECTPLSSEPKVRSCWWQSAVVECPFSLRSDLNFTYMWRHDGRLSNEDDPYMNGRGVQQEKTSFRRLVNLVINVRFHQEGFYTCELIIPRQNRQMCRCLQSKLVTSDGSYTVDLIPSEPVAFVGHSFRLKCLVHACKSSVLPTWSFSNASKEFNPQIQTFRLSKSTKMSILSVPAMRDADSNVKFTCSIGGYGHKDYTVRLENRLSAPELRFANASAPNTDITYVVRNSTVKLACSFHGNPAPAVEWHWAPSSSETRTHSYTDRDNPYIVHSELVLNNYQGSPQGNVTCSGINAKGSSNHFMELVVVTAVSMGEACNSTGQCWVSDDNSICDSAAVCSCVAGFRKADKRCRHSVELHEQCASDLECELFDFHSHCWHGYCDCLYYFDSQVGRCSRRDLAHNAFRFSTIVGIRIAILVAIIYVLVASRRKLKHSVNNYLTVLGRNGTPQSSLRSPTPRAFGRGRRNSSITGVRVIGDCTRIGPAVGTDGGESALPAGVFESPPPYEEVVKPPSYSEAVRTLGSNESADIRR